MGQKGQRQLVRIEEPGHLEWTLGFSTNTVLGGNLNSIYHQKTIYPKLVKFLKSHHPTLTLSSITFRPIQLSKYGTSHLGMLLINDKTMNRNYNMREKRF